MHKNNKGALSIIRDKAPLCRNKYVMMCTFSILKALHRPKGTAEFAINHLLKDKF